MTNKTKVSFGNFALTISTENDAIPLTCEQMDEIIVKYFQTVNEETISQILEKSGYVEKERTKKCQMF